MGRIVAIGMSNTDLVCSTPHLPRPGETVAGTALEIFAGGKGANQAVAAARAGANVAFAGAVGDDAYGADRLADLATAGIDLALVQMIPDVPSGIAIVIVDRNGENQIVTAAGSNGKVDGRRLAQQLSEREFDTVLMTWEFDLETSMAIIRGLDTHTPLILSLAPYDDSIRRVFPDQRLIVVCNSGEASQLLGRSIAVDEAAGAARDIQAQGCRAAIVTLGAAGVVGADDDHTWLVAAPTTPVVDTTGAGDAFCGALAAWIADGATLEEASRAGVAAGSCSVSIAGAQPSLPTRDAILSLKGMMNG